MRSKNTHHIVAVDAYRVPKPFCTFAVRSDEPLHAAEARAPYGRVHVLRSERFDAADLTAWAADGLTRVDIEAPLAVDYAATTLAELAALGRQNAGLARCIASALQLTGVLGDDTSAYLHSVESRIDYLACSGAGFHNDVTGPWSRSLFWVLTLAAADVEFVMPHAGVRLLLAPGDLLVFDQTLAHGLCRPADAGQAVAASFEAGAQRQQMFLTGELRLTDVHWAALGSPWLPIEHHAQQRALDLMLAEFDERTGHIQRLHTLRDGMQRSTCHVDADEFPAPATVSPPS